VDFPGPWLLAMEKNYVHTGCKYSFLQSLTSITWRTTKTD
jgi:hypothetical protein